MWKRLLKCVLAYDWVWSFWGDPCATTQGRTVKSCYWLLTLCGGLCKTPSYSLVSCLVPGEGECWPFVWVCVNHQVTYVSGGRGRWTTAASSRGRSGARPSTTWSMRWPLRVSTTSSRTIASSPFDPRTSPSSYGNPSLSLRATKEKSEWALIFWFF